MLLKYANGSWNWWRVNAIFNFGYGIQGIVSGVFASNFWTIALGVLSTLIGWAFWKESLRIFYFERTLLLVAGFFTFIAFLLKGFQLDFVYKEGLFAYIDSILSIASLVSFVLLWRQLKSEKKIKW